MSELLLVEDDRLFREALAQELGFRGYAVVEAAGLAEIPSRGMFSHAIVDLRLGAENGLDAVQRIALAWPGCRIIVLTGYGSIATAVRAVKLGAAEYLTKPLSTDDLARALAGSGRPAEAVATAPLPLDRHEREYIEYVLTRCEGNVSRAARELGLHRQSLQRKLRKFTEAR